MRITTRYDRDDLPCALFGMIHETGHALYEQGVVRRSTARRLPAGRSLGIHESQSRLWENLVGREPRLLALLLPDAAADLPAALGGVSARRVLLRASTRSAVA